MWQCCVCLTESRPISGRFSTVKHCDLAGFAGTCPSLAENAWFVNDLELAETRWITYTMFLWVCTHEFAHLDACVHLYMRDHLQMFRFCIVLLCCACSVGDVDPRVHANKSPNSYLICNLFIYRAFCKAPMAMYWYEINFIYVLQDCSIHF